LALVQELVKLHGGHVKVESVVGEGTAFTVWLPFGHRHLPPDHVQPTLDLPARRTMTRAFVEEALRWLPSDGSVESVREDLSPVQPAFAGRIVVADDNADMRDYVARLLASTWDVEVVSDGGAALAAIQRSTPDLLVSDIMMPGMDGFETLREIRRKPEWSSLPIIAVTARAMKGDREKTLRAGAWDYLAKPVDAEHLLSVLESWLQR
jgi:CheY-like chemotaxis protein